MIGYTKLFSSIIASTVWRDTKDVKILWVTMLALKNEFDIVEASAPGLADMARLTVDETRVAIIVLESPDPDSRTSDFEGRRIQKVEGGWLILNGEKYRRMMDADDQRAKATERKRLYRARLNGKSVPHSVPNCPIVSSMSLQAEAEAETKEKKQSPKSSSLLTDQEWMKAISEKYPGVNVEGERRKMEAWLMTPRGKGRKLTRGFIVNWLNKCDVQVGGSVAIQKKGVTNLANFK